MGFELPYEFGLSLVSHSWTKSITEDLKTMKVLVHVPMDTYRELYTHCDIMNPNHRLLRSALVAHDKRRITIRCETNASLDFIAWASECSPKAARRIQVFPD